MSKQTVKFDQETTLFFTLGSVDGALVVTSDNNMKVWMTHALYMYTQFLTRRQEVVIGRVFRDISGSDVAKSKFLDRKRENRVYMINFSWYFQKLEIISENEPFLSTL